MKKKKFAAGLLAILLLAGTIQAETAYAASPSLSAAADAGSVAKGDYVNVDVKLSNNPSISTLGAALNYDGSVLKYDSSTWNSGFSGSDMQMASDTGSEVNLSVVCDDSYAADGTVVTVRFQALKDASSIPVTLALRDMADAGLTEISDCTVSSAVRAPQVGKEPEESGIVDLQNPDETAGIDIVDEAAKTAKQEGNASNAADGGTSNASVGTAQGTQAGSASGNTARGMSAGMAQGTSAGSTPQGASGAGSTPQAALAAQPSGLDANYQTGIGLGSDALLLGAAAFGILALVLALRHYREEK